MTKARDLSVVPNQTLGMKNRLIDAGFIINQRGYASGTPLSAGVYAHDRWKAGASGCTYTFTQGSLGVPITITITAGSLQQIIEGCNMGEGGTYILSWTGTAQARINGGSYSASPLIVSGITAGANTTIEFGTGTVLQPQLEKGSTATSFDYRPYGTELALCQRYYQFVDSVSTGGSGSGFAMQRYADNTNTYANVLSFIQTMRASPTITFENGMRCHLPTLTVEAGTFSAMQISNQTAWIMVVPSSTNNSGIKSALIDGDGSSSKKILINAEL